MLWDAVIPSTVFEAVLDSTISVVGDALSSCVVSVGIAVASVVGSIPVEEIHEVEVDDWLTVDGTPVEREVNFSPSVVVDAPIMVALSVLENNDPVVITFDVNSEVISGNCVVSSIVVNCVSVIPATIEVDATDSASVVLVSETCVVPGRVVTSFLVISISKVENRSAFPLLTRWCSVVIESVYNFSAKVCVDRVMSIAGNKVSASSVVSNMDFDGPLLGLYNGVVITSEVKVDSELLKLGLPDVVDL